MTQSEPRVIDADDLPAFTGDDNPPEPTTFADHVGQQLLEERDRLSKRVKPETPKEMQRYLLTEAQEHADIASENAYAACDWLALLDNPLADRYRKSARSLFELSEHLAILIEES